jgi:hypothetical protein
MDPEEIPAPFMSRPYDLVDTDGYVLEPLRLRLNHIDTAFREPALRLGIINDGAKVLQLRDQAVNDNGPGPRLAR